MNASETLQGAENRESNKNTQEGSAARTAASRRNVLGMVLGATVAATLGNAETAVALQMSDSTPGPAATPEVADATGTPTSIVLVSEEPATGEPERGGALRLVRPGVSVSNFNPSAFAQDPQIPISYLEPLVRPDPATLVPRPHLATGWEWREGGLELRLTLRDDVTWHDGSPFTADDAAFSYAVYAEDIESAVSSLFQTVEAAEASSDHELVVRFSERDGSWLFNAATLPIFSAQQYAAHWAKTNGMSRTLSNFDWSRSHPLGTGPWRVSAWEERAVTFERSDNYWGRGPWLDTLEIAVEAGHRARVASWAAGESALLWPVRGQDLSGLPPDAGHARGAPAASVMFAAFNFANPDQVNGSIWSDLRVRRAASMAIDRERYAREVFAGQIRWDAAGTVAQPWAHDDALVNPNVNKEAATILLAEAGWLDYSGDGVREDVNGYPLMVTVILQEGSRPELSSVLARVARDLASVGFSVNIEALSAADFEDRWIRRRDFDLIAYAYDQLPGFTDFDLYGSAWDIRFNPAGWNPGGYANPEADAAIDDYFDAVTVERQAAALARLQRAVNDDLFGLWLGFPDDLILVHQGVAGFVPDMAWQTARTWDLWRAGDE